MKIRIVTIALLGLMYFDVPPAQAAVTCVTLTGLYAPFGQTWHCNESVKASGITYGWTKDPKWIWLAPS